MHRKVLLTDCRGEAWTACFTLQDFSDSEGMVGGLDSHRSATTQQQELMHLCA